VSDVFHTGSPDSALWEFKHGNGNFKRGDLIGLREIKRRVSRHALIHRDSFSGHKPAASQPGTPAEPMPETGNLQFLNFEHSLYEIVNRLTRVEESHALLSTRCQALAESLTKCHQVSEVTLPSRKEKPKKKGSNQRGEEAAVAIDSGQLTLSFFPLPILSGRVQYLTT
jgi:hypothetical protein